MSSRIALGTVQFGLSYGVANRSGQIGREEAAEILNHACRAGMDTLDTAITYGESERTLGALGVSRWTVITKLPPIPHDVGDVARWVREQVRGSLDRLNISRLGGLLLHHPKDLLGVHGDSLYRALLDVKDEGQAGKIGISVYGPDELEVLWPRFPVDLVQAPFSIIDRRLANSGWLARLSQAGVEVHVRSIFLQGLLLMDASCRPPLFDRWQPVWTTWHTWLERNRLTPQQACLGFALSQPEVARIVIGVD